MVFFREKTLMQAKSLSKNIKQITLRVDSSHQIFARDSPFECLFLRERISKRYFSREFFGTKMVHNSYRT